MKQKRTYAVDTVPVATDIRQRASDLGLIEELLRLAHHDPAWRARVERALTKDRLLGKSLPGGSKVADVWRRSLLRRQFVQKLEDDPVAFDAFAMAYPRVAELAEAGDEHNPDVLQEFPVIERVLAAYTLFVGDTALYGTALADACDELERQAEHCAEDPHDDSAADTVPTGEFETQPRALKESQTALLAAQKELKGVKAELRKSKADVSRRDRKAGELRQELKAPMAAATSWAPSCLKESAITASCFSSDEKRPPPRRRTSVSGAISAIHPASVPALGYPSSLTVLARLLPCSR